MVALSGTILGLKQLDKALKELPKATQKSVLRTAARRALKPIMQDARSRVHVDKGDLRDSIIISTKARNARTRRSLGRSGVRVWVGPSWPQGAHGHLEEFGTVKTPAHPFMRPSWDRGKDKVLDDFVKEISKGLIRTARRLGKQARTGKLSKSALKALRG